MTQAKSPSRSKRIPDPEKTAERLQRSSAQRFYDPDVDIDWDAPLVDGLRYMPEHRVSIYGTYLWDRLTLEQRLELGRQESIAIASFGIYAEVGLMMGLLRQVQEGDVTSARAQYALTEVAEECRHSTMFGRTIAKNGPERYPLPRLATRLATIIMAILPMSPAQLAGALFVEEPLDRLQRENMRNDAIQPHIRMVNRIHVTEEARHITFARSEVLNDMRQSGRCKLAFNRGLAGVMAWGFRYVLIEPRAYKRVGLNPREAFKVALANPHYRETLRWSFEGLVDFLEEAGFLQGRITMALWRRSGLLRS